MKMGLSTKTNDKLVRARLTQDLCSQEDTICVLQEFDIARGKARADVISVANGMIHAFEIKSDVDNLSRLPSQVSHYSKVFSTVTLIVGADHATEALYAIPDWWGVTIARTSNGSLDFYCIREAKNNSTIDYNLLVDLFRKDELVKLLSEHGDGGNYWKMTKMKLMNEAKKVLADEKLLREFSYILSQRAVAKA